MLFNGECAVSLRQNATQHVKALFRPWKLVKAGDTSPVGAFKTSTIEALHKGGKGSGQKKGEKSYIFPLVRYILRDLLWKTGDGDRFFNDLEQGNLI